jgi:hypothetical protein
MIDVTTKPRRFYRYLLESGFKLDVDAAGQLIVTTPAAWAETCTGGCPQPLADEIVKRAGLLVKLVRLDQLTGRPLLVHEFREARGLAVETGVDLTWQHMEFNGDQAGVWTPVEDTIPDDDRAAALEAWQEAALERIFAPE